MNITALLQRLREMPWTRQWRLLAGLAMLVVGAIALASWALAPEFAPLYPSLSDRDGGPVMAALDQAGYPYKLGPNGAVLVERTKIYEARYKLAAQGLPKSAADETLAPPKFGATSAQEAAYQQKTKELELARTISGIAGVGSARVHLALPRQTVFGKESGEPTASVALDSSQGVSRSQAAAIAHLVANAVPGMRPADVSVIDARGRLLTRDDQDSSDNPEQRAYATTLRQDLQARVERLLEPVVGRSGAKAEIDVDLEFGNEEAVTESWRPNQGEASVRSQQTAGSQQPGALAAGVPGSASNSLPLALPPLPGQTTAQSSATAGSSATAQSVTNYELDRSVVKSTRKGVKIKRIRAAILVDYKKSVGKDGKTQANALSAAELAKIQALAQEAIGIDEERGDTVQVLNMPFVESAAQDAQASELAPWRDPYLVEMALLAAKWLGALVLAFAILRTARNLLRDLSAPIPSPPRREDDNEAGEPTRKGQPIDLSAAKQRAQGDPKAVAAVISGWVDGDDNE